MLFLISALICLAALPASSTSPWPQPGPTASSSTSLNKPKPAPVVPEAPIVQCLRQLHLNPFGFWSVVFSARSLLESDGDGNDALLETVADLNADLSMVTLFRSQLFMMFDSGKPENADFDADLKTSFLNMARLLSSYSTSNEFVKMLIDACRAAYPAVFRNDRDSMQTANRLLNEIVQGLKKMQPYRSDPTKSSVMTTDSAVLMASVIMLLTHYQQRILYDPKMCQTMTMMLHSIGEPARPTPLSTDFTYPSTILPIVQIQQASKFIARNDNVRQHSEALLRLLRCRYPEEARRLQQKLLINAVECSVFPRLIASYATMRHVLVKHLPMVAETARPFVAAVLERELQPCVKHCAEHLQAWIDSRTCTLEAERYARLMLRTASDLLSGGQPVPTDRVPYPPASRRIPSFVSCLVECVQLRPATLEPIMFDYARLMASVREICPDIDLGVQPLPCSDAQSEIDEPSPNPSRQASPAC